MNENFIAKLQTNNYLIGSFDAYIDLSKELIEQYEKDEKFLYAGGTSPGGIRHDPEFIDLLCLHQQSAS